MRRKRKGERERNGETLSSKVRDNLARTGVVV